MKTNVSIAYRRFVKHTFKLSFIVLLFLPISLLSQETLKFERTIPIDVNKKKKVIKDIDEWISTQPNLTLTLHQTSPEEVINLDGSFTFENTVKYDASATYSRMYIAQTNGNISYKISIFIKDNQLIFQVGDFKHSPVAKGERIEFGTITTSDTAPKNLKFDYDADWCDKVWANMKKLSEENAQRFFDTLPSNLISSR